ncbi:bifunctional UDP-sugar hydrolase/5'-nucleotidase [Clostridium sp. Ade.TY]|uniref:bifunctional metallophosphatase/5'-nucleotidase n=1 Tax=Clostridium sp. Ade.TY TaxID=1391647 RepID=UPI0003F54905|nr:bifunctional UDP-sugar hydrolase/5'-nucleotidase [Clostridium sp. Ade.TY]
MKNLKIYFTSDLHGYIYPTDYTNKDLKNIGLLNIINSYDKDENTLIIDSGDTIQGSPFTTYLSKTNFSFHPIAKIMNEGKYDFVTLGNHDFNYGYNYLKSYINNLDATCICANVVDKTNQINIKPYSIKTLGNGLKIGLIGFTTDYINVWEQKENLTNFEINDTFENVKKYHDELKNKVDILIGVYHGGFENDIKSGRSLSSTSENIAYKIAKYLNFDILLTGHQHMEIEGFNLFNTYIVQTPQNGSKYIELNAEIEDNVIKSINSNLIIPKINPNKKMYNELLNIENDVQKWLDTPVGFLDCPLNPESHIKMALEGSNLANFINQVQLEKSNADISCTSFANVIKGFNKSVTVRDIVSTYVYPNTLVVLNITSEILKKALFRCSQYFAIENNKIKVSNLFLEPKVEHYNYDYFSNIEYEFDLSKEGLDRVSNIKFKGKDIKDTDTFKLVMNNYRASGTGGYEFFKDCPIEKDIQTEMTEIIIDYFTKHKNVVVDKTKYINIKKIKD